MTAVSETARVIARLVPRLPEATQRDLRVMLSHSIASPSLAELREARIGLLVEMVMESDDLEAVSDRYEQLRVERRAAGEEWPSRSQLSRAYGGWLPALDAALKLSTTVAPGAPSHKARERAKRSYTRPEVIHAIQRCARTTGTTPTMTLYAQWARLAKRAAHQQGKAEPPIPSLHSIARAYGTWSRALEVARRHSAQGDADA